MTMWLKQVQDEMKQHNTNANAYNAYNKLAKTCTKYKKLTREAFSS